MGIKAWAKLSVLLLAAAAFVGCNNGPDKNKKVLGATPGSPPPNAFSNPSGGAFPTAPKDNFGSPNGLSPVGNRPNPNASPFGPPSNPGAGFNGIPTPPGNLQPMNSGISGGFSNPSFAPERNTSPVLPLGGSGSSTPNFGGGGGTTPSIPVPNNTTWGTGKTNDTIQPAGSSGGSPALPKPPNF